MIAARRRNLASAVFLFGTVAAMVGLSYAAVPLYKLFCQVTGFGGTTRVATTAPGAVAGHVITVRFDANVSRDMPWRFEPVETSVKVPVGENTIIYYRARNLSDKPVTGSATFNVTPYKAGPYFAKIDCFCFSEQTLAPGETAEMPVSFFIDPAILEQPDSKDVEEITLSYTFFRAIPANRG